MSSLYIDSIKVIVLDIEGTVCPISFVKDELFPYFLKKISGIISTLDFPLDRDSQDEITKVCSLFPDDKKKDSESLLGYVRGLVDEDIKDPILKSLQGIIWKLGYESGEIRAPLYKDSIELIKKSRDLGFQIYIYSSGSVPAQKLLFGHVEGSSDLNEYLFGYFDINTSGFKQDASSYSNILSSIKLSSIPNSVLFLSDSVREVNAAIEAGMQAAVVVREGNVPLSEEERASHSILHSFECLIDTK